MLPILSFLTALTAAPVPACPGCEATIELRDVHAEELIGALRITESLPLDGVVVHWRPDAGYSTVRVATTPEYAAANGISAFDVANKVLALSKAHADWDVQYISATVGR
jgi:hypothetical protein